jgi:hypothetical protein
MTEPNEAAAQQDDAEPDPASTEDGDTERTPDDNEAAKYRRKLRDAESKLAAQDERLQTMQRNEAQRLAAVKLADPQDLWRDGATLADVLDDAGHVDPGKLDELVGTVLGAHKHWARQQHPSAAAASSVTSNGKIEDDGQDETTWAQVLNPNNHR